MSGQHHSMPRVAVGDSDDMRARWLVVPVKAFGLAKERLSPVLSPIERAALARELAGHTMDVVVESSVRPAFVVTSDEEAAAMAKARGLSVLPDEGHDHSSAMRSVGRLAHGAGVAALVTLAADLPLLTASDVRELAEAVLPATFVIAPDHAGTGTNAIAVAPPAFPFAFGPGSRTRHTDSARRLGLQVKALVRPGFAIDIDEPADIRLLDRLGVRTNEDPPRFIGR